jgi:hypothetical protein
MAIEKLSGMDLSPLRKIIWAREFRVSKWLSEGATSLVGALESFHIENIAQVLGWETTARLYALHAASQRSTSEKEVKELRASLYHSVHVNALQCIGCKNAPQSTRHLTRGCACGGHQYDELGPPPNPPRHGYAFSTVRRSVSGYRVIQESGTLPQSSTSANHASCVSATVTSLFGGEIEAMKTA